MNQSKITTSSGDIIVIDEYGKPKEVENSNNLEQILIQENKIEAIVNRTEELEEEMSKCPSLEKINQQKFIPYFSVISTIASFIWPIIDCLLRGNSAIFTSTFSTFFSIYSEIFRSSLSTYLVTLLLGICFDVSTALQIKNSKKNYNANAAELAALKRILPKEKEQLRQLNKGKKILPKNNQAQYRYNISMEMINDQKCLNELNDYLEFYRIVGIDLPKLYELYLDGSLDLFFKESGYEFSKEEYKILEDYIKENGPSTVLKKVRKRKIH